MELILDDGLPAPLAAELRGRGREARSVAELGLRGAADAELLAAVGRRVLVTTDDRLPGARGRATVAVIERTPAGVRIDRWRRDVVHRWAAELAGQPAGSARRYALTGHRPWAPRALT